MKKIHTLICLLGISCFLPAKAAYTEISPEFSRRTEVRSDRTETAAGEVLPKPCQQTKSPSRQPETKGAGVPVKLAANRHGAVQLVVNGRPFLLIAGELHNSSNSTVASMNSLWASLEALHLNTVLAPVAWEQFEPQEGVYDYTLVDNLIEGARKHGMKVVILWFGSWKNGESSYAPLWVKDDTRRFLRVKNAAGREIETLSPFCEATMKADARAFRALALHIRATDQATGTVIALQPENEAGIFQDMDYSDASRKAYRQPVPQDLLRYMKKNRLSLRPELLAVWERNGAKTSGTWQEVFGNNAWSKSFYTVWHYARYIDYVAACAKEAYPLPMFCNCWLVQQENDLPGVYPNGGPVSRVADIWKAAAPHIDILAPDIYLPDFKGIAADYHRPDNPLLIPESTMRAAHAFWAFGRHDALGYSPFGIEDGTGNFVFAESYRVLNELMPLITEYQGSGRMHAVMREPGEPEPTIESGAYRLHIAYETDDAYGLIIRTDANEFLVAGLGFQVTFSSVDSRKTGYIKQVWEGGFAGGRWQSFRLLNGDETYHNARLLVRGRRTCTPEKTTVPRPDRPDGIFVYSPLSHQTIHTPGIYRVTVYLR